MTDPKDDTKAADLKAAAAKAKAEKAAAAKEKAEAAKKAKKIKVICQIANGRRRCGRRWDGGENFIPVSEMTVNIRKEIEADPMFRIVD